MKGAPPKVVIDARMVGDVSHGISRYVRMIAKGLAELPSLSYEPIFLSGPDRSAAFSGFETMELRTPFLDPKEMLLIPAALWKTGAKLYHSPSFSSLLAAPCPWMVTVHDLNHITYGGPMERAYYETVLRSFTDRAKAVLTVSEFSKTEIERWNRKLHPEVIYNAIDPQFLKEGGNIDETLARYGVTRDRYFICLSNEKPHKNLSTLVHAYQNFRETSAEAREFKLIVSVAGYANEPGVVAAPGISDADVHGLLRGSRALVFPSIYEGFGLPPVEGATLGCPIIVSDIPAHREALRDLSPTDCTWVQPLDESGWVSALRKAAAGGVRPISSSARQKLIERYSVENLGRAMDRVYRRVLGLSV